MGKKKGGFLFEKKEREKEKGKDSLEDDEKRMK
jgi:hypothetical protein